MKIPLREYWAWLTRYLRPLRLRVAALAVLLLTSIAVQLVNPQIMRAFLDQAQSGGAMSELVRLALLFLALALVQQALSVGASYFSTDVGWAATNSLRSDLAEHCMGLDLSFHNAHTPGEMIERIDGDVAALTDFFSQFVIQVLGNGLLLVGILVLLFGVDWRVGLTLTLFVVVALALLLRFRDLAVPHWKAEREASADLFGFLEERMAGTEDIRANGAEGYVMRRFYVLMRQLLRRSLQAALMINVLINTSFLLFALGTAAAFAVGAWLFGKGALSIGTVYVIFFYTSMLERPIEQITRQMDTFQRAGAGLVRVRELSKIQSRLPDGDPALRIPGGALAVEFRSVTFGYSDAAPTSPRSAGAQSRPEEEDESRANTRPETPDAGQVAEPAVDGTHSAQAAKEMVLRGVSFALRPGKVLGLLGRTGSGKTTLTRLLLRLFDPDEGEVCLGEPGALTDLRLVSLHHLRQRVGTVTQNIQLFHGTVRDNLTFFDASIGDGRIAQVLNDLGLSAWLAALPHGLDTELESGGGGLSAGQAQLLAFARVFLRDPGLVILDEASSRLDPATEQLVERAIDRLMSGRTAIIVAHRLHTIQRADEILILEEGRICESGDRAALAADPSSRFSSLLQAGLEEVLA